jgi:sugar transferase (PEP-CTERM system associated)
MFYSAMYFGSEVRFMWDPSWYSQQEILYASIIFSVVLTVSCVGMGLYRKSLAWDDYVLLPRVCISFSVAIFILVSIYYLLPEFKMARGVFGVAIGFAFIGFLLSRYIFDKYVNLDHIMRKVLIIGSGDKANKLIALNEEYMVRGFTIVGFVPIEEVHSEEAHLGEVHCSVDTRYLIKDERSINEIAQHYNIDEIVIALDDRRNIMPSNDLLDCKMSGIHIMDLMTFYEREQGLIYLENLFPSWLVFSDGFAQSGLRSIGKRIYDILASTFLLLVTWPVMLLTTIAIVMESGVKAPIFYRQLRVGENNKNFNVIKFRSMVPDAEQNGAQWAAEEDSRITKVGSFIRMCRIDELPQIFNVLKGQMSFVGPRPERPEFVKGFEKRIPYYRERHRVKPGITGWAQLCYPYAADEQDTIQKLQYDLYYVKNYSLFLDLNIMIHTIEVVLWGKGAR